LQRSLPSLLTTAACSGLRPAPDCRPRRTFLHLSYSYAPPCGPAMLVTQDRLAELERRNRAISESLNKRLEGTGLKADTCHSADHLLRLAGTTNFVTKKKLAKGYPPGNRPARIVAWNPERVYTLEELPSCSGPNEGSG